MRQAKARKCSPAKVAKVAKVAARRSWSRARRRKRGARRSRAWLGQLDDGVCEAVGLGIGGRHVARVALVDVGQSDRVAGRVLRRLGQCRDLGAVLLVGRRQ